MPLPTKGSSYKYSFSGSDITNQAWFDVGTRYGVAETAINTSSIPLETLTTVSFEISERKGEVRALGNRAVRGHTSAIRTIAGTMVFSVINEHPLAKLIALYEERYGDINEWLYTVDSPRNYTSDLAFLHMPTTLPPFNLLLFGTTELDFVVNDSVNINYAMTGLLGIEFISEQMVYSINNILTEIIYTFRALDHQVLLPQSGIASNSNSLKSIQTLIDLGVAAFTAPAASTSIVPDLDSVQALTIGKTSSSGTLPLGAEPEPI